MKDNLYDFCDYINCSLIEIDIIGDVLYLLLLILKNFIFWYICVVFWDFIEIKLINYLLNLFLYIDELCMLIKYRYCNFKKKLFCI